MIRNIRALERKELENQIVYLKQSPVAQIGFAIEQGIYKLEKGEITSRQFLGETRTIFSELGNISAQKEFHIEKFLVNQIWDILHRVDCTDVTSRKSLDYLKSNLANESHKPNVTVLDENDYMIVDGNKTATAFFNLGSNEEINLPVYIVSKA